MIDKKYIELMNKEIDRVITPGEKQELHNYLSVNEAARNYYDGLLSAVDYAENLADFNPPENLKKRIMNSIDFSLYESKTRSKKTLSFLWGLKFKYAYTFAAGLLAAILIYTFFTLNSGKVNNDEIYGTIGAAGNIKTIQEIQLNFSDISGKIELKESENNFWFVISADTPQETEFIVTYPDQVHFDNVTPGTNSNIEVSKSKNYIKITNSGSQQYSLQFSRDVKTSSPIHVRIIQSGNTIYDHELALIK